MDRSTRYPKEVRERAVRLVFEHERDLELDAIRDVLRGK